MDQQKNNPISFSELHGHLIQDPYYGVDSAACESMINGIYEDQRENVVYEQFRHRYRLLPCKTDLQRHLIYLWVGLMGLPAHKEGSPINQDWKYLLDHWTQDFVINLGELKDFLRNHRVPLPAAFFPEERDNSKNKILLEEEEFERAFDEAVILLPQLEEELAEIRNIQPESMEARQQKKDEIERIEKEIAAIYAGDKKPKDETPQERQLRLKAWFEEEERKRPNGALKRAAEREGITRQTLSAILKRRYE